MSGVIHQFKAINGEWVEIEKESFDTWAAADEAAGRCECRRLCDYDAMAAERDQLKAEVEALRKDAFFHRHTQRQAELYQNVQMAAGSLPDGWQVVIEIERDAGTVSLLDGDGEAVDEEFGDSGDLADQVAEALKYAVSKESE